MDEQEKSEVDSADSAGGSFEDRSSDGRGPTNEGATVPIPYDPSAYMNSRVDFSTVFDSGYGQLGSPMKPSSLVSDLDRSEHSGSPLPSHRVDSILAEQPQQRETSPIPASESPIGRGEDEEPPRVPPRRRKRRPISWSKGGPNEVYVQSGVYVHPAYGILSPDGCYSVSSSDDEDSAGPSEKVVKTAASETSDASETEWPEAPSPSDKEAYEAYLEHQGHWVPSKKSRPTTPEGGVMLAPPVEKKPDPEVEAMKMRLQTFRAEQERQREIEAQNRKDSEETLQKLLEMTRIQQAEAKASIEKARMEAEAQAREKIEQLRKVGHDEGGDVPALEDRDGGQAGSPPPPYARQLRATGEFASESEESDAHYACQQDGCGRGFSRPEHLYRHQLSHTTTVLFKCNVYGCQRTFVREDLRDRHQRRHIAENVDSAQPLDFPSRLGILREETPGNVGEVPSAEQVQLQVQMQIGDIESSLFSRNLTTFTRLFGGSEDIPQDLSAEFKLKLRQQATAEVLQNWTYNPPTYRISPGESFHCIPPLQAHAPVVASRLKEVEADNRNKEPEQSSLLSRRKQAIIAGTMAEIERRLDNWLDNGASEAEVNPHAGKRRRSDDGDSVPGQPGEDDGRAGIRQRVLDEVFKVVSTMATGLLGEEDGKEETAAPTHPPKRYTDEELKEYAIHMANRFQTEYSKGGQSREPRRGEVGDPTQAPEGQDDGKIKAGLGVTAAALPAAAAAKFRDSDAEYGGRREHPYQSLSDSDEANRRRGSNSKQVELATAQVSDNKIPTDQESSEKSEGESAASTAATFRDLEKRLMNMHKLPGVDLQELQDTLYKFMASNPQFNANTGKLDGLLLDLQQTKKPRSNYDASVDSESSSGENLKVKRRRKKRKVGLRHPLNQPEPARDGSGDEYHAQSPPDEGYRSHSQVGDAKASEHSLEEGQRSRPSISEGLSTAPILISSPIADRGSEFVSPPLPPPRFVPIVGGGLPRTSTSLIRPSMFSEDDNMPTDEYIPTDEESGDEPGEMRGKKAE
ncbi:hypothetical protein OQA88_8046 [Cercophora sp. LCS_1]